MNEPKREKVRERKKIVSSLAFCLIFVAGLFIIPGFIGFSYEEVYESDEDSVLATATSMENMTASITDLITQIIPVFVIIGIFGVIIGMVTKMMKDFGS